MKRVFTFAAAIVAAMVMLVSCISENKKKTIELSDALAADDAAKVSELVNQLSSVKDQLTAEDAVCVVVARITQIAKAQDAAEKAQAQEELFAFYENVKAKEGFDKYLAEAKNEGLDVVAVIDGYKAEIAAAQKAAEEATAAAEEEEGEESEEYDAEVQGGEEAAPAETK